MRCVLLLVFAVALVAAAQEPAPNQTTNQSPNQAPNQTQSSPEPALPAGKTFLVDTGTHVPLSLINSVSTKNAIVGDRIYLETVFPVLVDGRIVIPPGSYVAGTITDIKRPGRVKGRGELYLRFDSLTLPNGVTRDFRARVGGIGRDSTRGRDAGGSG